MMITQRSFVLVGFCELRQSNTPNNIKQIGIAAKKMTKALIIAEALCENIGDCIANQPSAMMEASVMTKSRTGDRQMYALTFFMFEQALERALKDSQQARV
jgi:hypothetical protein